MLWGYIYIIVPDNCAAFGFSRSSPSVPVNEIRLAAIFRAYKNSCVVKTAVEFYSRLGYARGERS
jgi:hypothetical protein